MSSAMTLEMMRDELSKHGHEFGYETCERFVQAIDAHLADKAGARVDGWMPIESAPKDGTRILIHRSGVGKYSTTVGWWNSADASWRDVSHLFRDPSHWMPLPPGPNA